MTKEKFMFNCDVCGSSYQHGPHRYEGHKLDLYGGLFVCNSCWESYAQRFWRILVQAERMLQLFRARFIGKCSPVRFFWGSFDLAVTRFSGQSAPKHPGGIPNVADAVTWEAFSHEVSSCGFWPGGGAVTEPMFYAYAYPEPNGFDDYPIRSAEAFYYAPMREFFLPYEAVRRAPDPDATLLAFAQNTYEAAANLGHWERTALEQIPT